MYSRRDVRNEGGAALIVALGVVSVMVIIAVTVTVLSMNSSETVGNDIRLTEAQNFAEAGVDDAIAVTLENYGDVYPGGYIPDYPGDGMPFYDSPKEMKDAQGNVLGSYEIWTKQDPERPGNVLITAEGTMGAEQSKVRVSVKYTPAIFDYALLVGDPDNPTNGSNCVLDMKATGSSSFSITGKVHVNGCFTADGEDNSSEEGNINFISRDGYDDTVTYTDDFSGTVTGTQPAPGDEITFPTVNYDALPNKVTINLSNNENFRIDADDFEAAYGSYDVVEFIGAQGAQAKITINGSGDDNNPWIITTTLSIPPQTNSSSSLNIKNLDLKGPGLSLQPKNGIAIVADEGRIEVWKGTSIGAPGAGALVYITGEFPKSEFEYDKGAELYGSLVASMQLEMKSIGGSASDSPRDKSVKVEYDSAFLSMLPFGWLSGGEMTAYKENFERDNS